jgi:hypothetical protein
MADKKFEVLDGMLVSGNASFDSGVLFVDSVNNRVGVNRINPTTALDINGTVTATTFSGSGASLTSIPQSAVTDLGNDFLRSNSNDTYNGGTLTVNNSSTIQVTAGKILLNDAQKLAIGHTSSGNVEISFDATGDSMNVTSTAANVIFKTGAGTNVLYLDTATSSASVNSVPSAGFALYVSGDTRTVGELSATGDVVAYASDRRLKNIVSKIQNPLDKIEKISGYYFEWDKEACEEAGFVPAAEAEHGLIAQEVEEIMPEFVVPAPFNEEYKTLKYDRMVSLLVECIKELRQEIADLKDKIR